MENGAAAVRDKSVLDQAQFEGQLGKKKKWEVLERYSSMHLYLKKEGEEADFFTSGVQFRHTI